MAPTATLPTKDNAETKHHESSSEPLSVGEVAAKQMVFNMMNSRVAALKDLGYYRVGCDDAFIFADIGDVYRKHMAWKTHLGRVKPHYGECVDT